MQGAWCTEAGFTLQTAQRGSVPRAAQSGGAQCPPEGGLQSVQVSHTTTATMISWCITSVYTTDCANILILSKWLIAVIINCCFDTQVLILLSDVWRITCLLMFKLINCGEMKDNIKSENNTVEFKIFPFFQISYYDRLELLLVSDNRTIYWNNIT